MTAASSTHQALIQVCTWSGSGAMTATLAAAAAMPIQLGHRRAPVAYVPPRLRVVGATAAAVAVLVIGRLLRPGWSVPDARSGAPASRRENRQVPRRGSGRGRAHQRSSGRAVSSARELTPSLLNTLRRWKSTVRGLTNS